MNKPESWIRDRLALDRTILANERTLLAYVRTSIMLAVAGGTLLKLYAEQSELVVSGWVLMIVGMLIALIGVHRYRRLGSRLSRQLGSDD